MKFTSQIDNLGYYLQMHVQIGICKLQAAEHLHSNYLQRKKQNKFWGIKFSMYKHSVEAPSHAESSQVWKTRNNSGTRQTHSWFQGWTFISSQMFVHDSSIFFNQSTTTLCKDMLWSIPSKCTSKKRERNAWLCTAITHWKSNSMTIQMLFRVPSEGISCKADSFTEQINQKKTQTNLQTAHYI